MTTRLVLPPPHPPETYCATCKINFAPDTVRKFCPWCQSLLKKPIKMIVDSFLDDT